MLTSESKWSVIIIITAEEIHLPLMVDMATVTLPSVVWQYKSSIPSAFKSPTDRSEIKVAIDTIFLGKSQNAFPLHTKQIQGTFSRWSEMFHWIFTVGVCEKYFFWKNGIHKYTLRSINISIVILSTLRNSRSIVYSPFCIKLSAIQRKI